MASTYDNDLRLNEMGTGDASGVWGTNTNTNLQLIGEGLSFTTKIVLHLMETNKKLYLMVVQTLQEVCILKLPLLQHYLQQEF